MNSNNLQNKTIRDFGTQWTKFKTNDGYYGSFDMFKDIIYPLKVEEIFGKKVAEIGSGTGRIVKMLLAAEVNHVVAIEPSDAFYTLFENLNDRLDRVALYKITGEHLSEVCSGLDYVFSIGVLHHIPDPDPVIKSAYDSLRPSGTFVIWLYGKEGNGFYLLITETIRKITTQLPHSALKALSFLMNFPLNIYILICKYLKLPLYRYMTEVLGKMTSEKRRLVIYDQLNPAYAKYYSRAEAMALLEKSGFIDLKIHHRHGYSWTVIGTKPGVNSFE